MNNYIKIYDLKEYKLERTVIIKTDLQYSHLQIIFKRGANSDPLGKNGMCHLCEHILLEMVDKEIRKCTDIALSYMGYVDYTYSVLNFIANCKNNDSLEFTRVVLHTLNNLVLSGELIELVKRDVIFECSRRMNETIESKKSNIFLTDNTINVVPIGKINEIRSIKDEEIWRYINELKKTANFLLISSVKELPEDIKKDIRLMINNDEIFLKQVYPKRIDKFYLNIKSESRKNCLRFFVLHKQGLEKIEFEIVEKLMQIIFSKRIYYWIIEKLGYEEMTLKILKKQLSLKYTYTIIEINNLSVDKYDILENTIKEKMTDRVSQKEYEEHVKYLRQMLDNIQLMNDTYIKNNFIKKVIFNESLLITREQCLIWKKKLDILQIDDINKIKDELFCKNHKVIKYY